MVLLIKNHKSYHSINYRTALLMFQQSGDTCQIKCVNTHMTGGLRVKGHVQARRTTWRLFELVSWRQEVTEVTEVNVSPRVSD